MEFFFMMESSHHLVNCFKINQTGMEIIQIIKFGVKGLKLFKAVRIKLLFHIIRIVIILIIMITLLMLLLFFVEIYFYFLRFTIFFL